MTSALRRWGRGGRLRALVVVVPPLLAVLTVALILAFRGETAAPTVELREDGTPTGREPLAGAIRAVESQTGMKVVLPTRLPGGGYRPVYIEALAANEAGSPGIGFGFEDSTVPGRPWFWVIQRRANAITIPLPIPEQPTGIDGAHLWLVYARPVNVADPQRLQYAARTAKYDRIISFEGTAGPDEQTAARVILSMLDQDR